MSDIRICFLCHGNICRSPMAEFVMKDLLAKVGRTDVIVESAALHDDEIGSDIHSGTRAVLRENGVPFAPRRAWRLTAAKAREYDFLIGMDSYNIADLKRLVYPEDRCKIRRLMAFAGSSRDVADPWYTGDFDATWADVTAGCAALLRALDGWSFVDLRRELAAGSRVLLLTRHAERPKIGHEDRTFGASVPLTPNGERMCEDFGELLGGLTTSVQFRASPLRRTVMTAGRIAKGMGIPGAEIPEDARIGNGSAFVADEGEMWESFRGGGFFAVMMDYFAHGTARGFAPLAEAAAAYERYVLSHFTASLGIFATHDVFVAAYLSGTGVKTDFDPENWPRFLDAAVIAVSPDGQLRRALFRAGLSDRAIGVQNS